MTIAPRTILVDVMDTLVREPYFEDVPAFFGMTLAELQAVQHPTAWIDFECGALGEDEYLANFFWDGRDFDHAGLRETLRAGYRWMPGAEEWLGALAAAGHRIHALSNYPVWWRMIEERFELSRLLRWSFVSCDTGVRKPDARAFTGALQALGVPAGEVLFIDDRESNVAAARACGIDARLCLDGRELRDELVRGGWLAG